MLCTEQGRQWLAACPENPVVSMSNTGESALSRDVLHAIEKDVPRVGWSPEDRRKLSLQILLERLARRLGGYYNQGLSFIGAFCLSHLSNIVEAERVVGWMLFEEKFELLLSPKSSFLQQYVDRFDFLFSRVLPELYLKFAQEKFETMFFAIDWFTTLFTNHFSNEVSTLVWNTILLNRLQDGLFLCGLAVLKSLQSTFLHSSGDMLFMEFKSTCKSKLDANLVAIELKKLTELLLGSPLLPGQDTTIINLEKRIQDPNDILVQIPFDATFLMRAVQLNDSKRISLEISKYQFPPVLLNYALFRAILRGHPAAVDVLRKVADPNGFQHILNGKSGIHIAAILGHGEVVRALLVDQLTSTNNNSSSGGGKEKQENKFIVNHHHHHNKGGEEKEDFLFSTTQQLISQINKLQMECGDDEHWSYVLACLHSKICWWCASLNHKTSDCLNQGEFALIRFGSSEHYCKMCEVQIHNSRRRRQFNCTRCQNAFCDRCADTFLTFNGQQSFRACTTCHHFWGSCSCVSSNVVCHHGTTDFMLKNYSVCECDACLREFITIKGARFFPMEFQNKMYNIAKTILDAVTEEVRAVGLKKDESKSGLS